MSDLIELDLSEKEAEAFKKQKTAISDNSRTAAQKAWAFAEMLGEMIKSYNASQDAQNEYFRLMQRAAKARARQPQDIVDIDFDNLKIVFNPSDKEKKVEPDGEDETPESTG